MEYVSGNIFIREMELAKAGDVVEGHTHNFDHTTYIVRGTVKIERLDAVTGEVLNTIVKSASMGHNWVLIKAECNHRLTAMTDNCMCHCIYSHRNGMGEIQEAYDGWTPGYV